MEESLLTQELNNSCDDEIEGDPGSCAACDYEYLIHGALLLHPEPGLNLCEHCYGDWCDDGNELASSCGYDDDD